MNNSKFEGGYFEFDTGIIRIKEIHNAMAKYSVLVEVDDYVGNFYSNLNWHWFLNNDNILIEMSDHILSKLIEVEEKDFSARLINEINYTINQVSNSNNLCFLYFKKTDIRMKPIRKHYGKIP